MRRWNSVALGVVPLVLLLAAMRSVGPERADRRAGQERGFDPARHFRTVVFILDSAGKSDMFDSELMPFVSSLQASSLSGRSRSCESKATFPCIKSIFEGREATMGSTLQDFSAFASSRTTWPASLAALGMRLVVASDHTLNRLYPHAFVDSIDYENVHAPLQEADAIVFGKARQWLDDRTIDGLVLHVTGTDHVAHDYPARGAVYRQKYREVDDFVREVAGRLQPDDYLFVISDHGHNELGGHTEDASYVARGPIFPPDLHQDLNAEDLLFLLSLPYGLTLPAHYEGQIRIDLTRLAPDLTESWLTAQGKSWGVPVAGLPIDQAQARLNEEIVRHRTADQRGAAFAAIWRTLPFWIAAALFLISELPIGRRSGRTRSQFLQIALFVFGLGLVWMGIAVAGWIIVAATFIRCLERFGLVRSFASLIPLSLLAAAAFWLFPAGLTWIDRDVHRPLGFLTFYAVAGGCGFMIARLRRLDSWRAEFVEILWVIGICVWLLGYFGPLGYSLTRHGSRVVLGILPIAVVIISGGWRTFASAPALFLPGLLPLVFYDVESFNLRYPVLDRIPQLPTSVQLVLAGIAALVFVLALSSGRDLRHWPRRIMPLLLVLTWLGLGAIFFQFPLSKLIGGLLACLWFAGSLELFRRARLPLRGFSLLSVLFLFLLLTFFLNGFALSHVDFRFAANKIIPFAKEVWRAPQLILWAMVKYAFALFPAFAVLRASAVSERVWPQLILLGWWRELTIVALSLGLAVFKARGMRDLCAEEIYFWTFLNLVLFIACLIFSRAWRSAAVPEHSIA
jgi:Type I phosphodiesterase / nucleotide pyrophosphatase